MSERHRQLQRLTARAWGRAVVDLCLVCLLLLLCLAASGPVGAGQASADLLVRVNVLPASAPPERVFCTSTIGPRSFGATVTLVCSTGAVVAVDDRDSTGRLILHGGARRYALPPVDGSPALGGLQAISTAGTVTGWQILRQTDRDYVELTWGW